MIELLTNFIQGKTSKIAKVTGKSEAEIESAIEAGKKYIPQARNATDGGAGLLKSLGVNREFLDEMYNRFGKYADRIPFIGRAVLDHEYKKMASGLDAPTPPNRAERRAASKAQGFDKSKYRKV